MFPIDVASHFFKWQQFSSSVSVSLLFPFLSCSSSLYFDWCFLFSSQCTSSVLISLSHFAFASSHFSILPFFLFQVNIMVLTRVVVITISTAKRRSIMLAMGTSPVEQAYEQMRYKPQGGAICPLFFLKNTHWPSSLGADKLQSLGVT